jgi:DNA-binding NarL/FixJ family response regulator
MNPQLELTSRYGMRTEEFSTLMKHRVLEILLVASHYDAFVLEEDGQLTELVFEEYRNLDLNLRYAPRFIRASSGAEASILAAERSFDMVITTPRLADVDLAEFVTRIKDLQPGVPVGLLAAHAWELPWLEELRASGAVEWVFLWQGNVRALLAMIKQVEDRRNADADILDGGVQAIVLVEDEVRAYSAYLPHIYTEVTTQTSRLMSGALNLSHRLLRIRARPKILLAQSYEEAWALYGRYSKNILGVISDVSFPRDGVLDEDAGLELAREIRSADEDTPILLQSADPRHEAKAGEVGAEFLWKSSPTLFEDLRSYILDHFGFGDFIFKLPDGTPIACARDMRELLAALATVPDQSLVYHASRNHFSSWLKARTEFELASLLRPRKVSEFASSAELRDYLIATLTHYLREIQRHVITDFDGDNYDRFVAFARIGTGSLGGKGRGLAFMHKLLASGDLEVDGVEITVPQTVVIASDVFDEYLDRNDLRRLALESDALSDSEILDEFRNGHFSDPLRSELTRFLSAFREPIAVRSSSILEDSVYQPFAGVYATIMLPNSHPSLDVRLLQLVEAIKAIYASTYFKHARAYIETTPYRIEEEVMAVLIQRLVGRRWGDRFYPTMSGVASSYNFYPFGSMKPEDGVAQIALGLGKTVVEGFEALRFSPRHPQVLPQFSSVKDILRNAQRRFYALDMTRHDIIPGLRTDANLLHLETSEAVEDGAAGAVASTYRRSDDRISVGLSEDGTPLITFAPLLRGRTLPLPDILTRLLPACADGLASPVEIEFASDIRPGLGRTQSFHVLQLRPLVVEEMQVEVELGPELLERALVRSEAALGHGRREAISDVIVVDPRRLDRSATAEAAMVIDRINRAIRSEGRQSILIGPGRWGSRDPWLGIPVTWPQISTVRAIVETDFEDLQIEPSLGSHFFHNLTCFGVAFFAAHQHRRQGWINWPWFEAHEAVETALGGALRHLRLSAPAHVLVDGASGHGVILEGGA